MTGPMWDAPVRVADFDASSRVRFLNISRP